MGVIEDVDLVTVVVEDQDEAIEFYVDDLGFELHQDEDYGTNNRWVEICPPGSQTRLTLKTPEMFDDEEAKHRRALIGGSPQITFRVDDCKDLYQSLQGKGVEFDDEPSEKPWVSVLSLVTRQGIKSFSQKKQPTKLPNKHVSVNFG